ncbi:MAG TPA: FUSC family protein [Candidatus Binatia bacterium]|nr:FUSC family protein [Candidatus Binatia bacterium]
MNVGRFLAHEMAPTPGRFRAAMRVVVACQAAIVLVMGLHIPYGHWAVITIFTVSQTDAGASLKKGIERVLGTILGGLVALYAIIAFADAPWVVVPLIGIGCGMGLFLSRTTTSPYVGMLMGITFAILLPIGVSEASADPALWRILVVAIGVALATGAQVWLWPDDPARLLLEDVGRVLATIENIVTRAACGETTVMPDALGASGLGRHLDLLANAEARHPSLRRRHDEQLALVTELDRLLTAALWLPSCGVTEIDPASAQRLAGIAARCTELRRALAAREAPAPLPAVVGEPASPALLASIMEMERALSGIAATLHFLGTPVDTPVEPPSHRKAVAFFSPAFSLQNTEAVRFALKGALASTIAYVLYHGLAWPGIATCVATCVIVAQTTTGAGTQKAILRIAGTLLGCALGLGLVVFAMPRLESLFGLLLVLAGTFFVAAWIVVGSPRTAYAGMQAGMALAMYSLDVFGPATNLVVGRDRVVGIVVGIIIMTTIDRWLWPVFAQRGLRDHMAAAMRAMATLSRVGLPDGADALVSTPVARMRRAVYDELRTVLRLRDEARFEPGAQTPAIMALREAGVQLSSDVQDVFLGLLAVGRHRADIDLGPLPPALHDPLHVLARSIGEALLAAADCVAGDASRAPADIDAAVLAVRGRLVTQLAAVPDTGLSPHVAARVALYRAVVPTLVRALDTTLALPLPEREPASNPAMMVAAAGT